MSTRDEPGGASPGRFLFSDLCSTEVKLHWEPGDKERLRDALTEAHRDDDLNLATLLDTWCPAALADQPAATRLVYAAIAMAKALKAAPASGAPHPDCTVSFEERAARDAGLYLPRTEGYDVDGRLYVLWSYLDEQYPGDQESIDITLERTLPVGREGSGDRADVRVASGGAVAVQLTGVTRASLARLADGLAEYVQRMASF